MNKTTRLFLGFLMILVGSLVALDNAWELRKASVIETMPALKCQHKTDDFCPVSFELYQDGNYTCVRIAGTDILLYHSLSSSEAVQWAIYNVPDRTSIDITEDIIMDGYLSYFTSGNKGYAMRSKGGYLIYDFE